MKQLKKPWITNGIIRSIKAKQKMYQTHMLNSRSRDSAKIPNYGKYSNMLNNIIKKRKKLYFASQFELNKTNLKRTWKIIGYLVKRKTKSQTLPTKLVVDNNVFVDKKEIANQFNILF